MKYSNKKIYREKDLDSGKKKLYTLVWEQCTKIIQNELSVMFNYENINKDQNSIELIKNIKSIIYSFRDNKYKPETIWRVYRIFFNLAQKEKNFKSYTERFNN